MKRFSIIFFLLILLTSVGGWARSNCTLDLKAVDAREFPKTGIFKLYVEAWHGLVPMGGEDITDPTFWKILTTGEDNKRPLEGQVRAINTLDKNDNVVTKVLFVVSLDPKISSYYLHITKNLLINSIKKFNDNTMISIVGVTPSKVKIALNSTSISNKIAIQSAINSLGKDQSTFRAKEVETIKQNALQAGDDLVTQINNWLSADKDHITRLIVILVDDGVYLRLSSPPECPQGAKVFYPAMSGVRRRTSKSPAWCHFYLIPNLDNSGKDVFYDNLRETAGNGGFQALFPIDDDSMKNSDRFIKVFSNGLSSAIGLATGEGTYEVVFKSDEDLDARSQIWASVQKEDMTCESREPITFKYELSKKVQWVKWLIIIGGSILGIILIIVLIKLVMHLMEQRRLQQAEDDAEAEGDESGIAKLVVLEGPDLGREFVLKSGDNRIGRAPTMDIVLSDLTVSRDHCMITEKNKIFEIKLTGGKTGILINGIQTPTKHTLQDGDEILLGQTKMKFVLTEDE